MVFLAPDETQQNRFGEIALQAIYQGFLVTIAAVHLLGFTSDRLGAERAALFVASIPILAMLLAVPILDEALGSLEIFGVGVCSAGLLVASLSRKPRGAMAETR